MTRPTSLLTLTRRGLFHPSTPRTALPLAPSAPRNHLRQCQPQSQIHTTTTQPNSLTTPRLSQKTSPKLSPKPRAYHSDHHPTQPHDYTNSQTTILSAALHHVPTHGFSRDALTLGCRDAGFLDVSVQLLPRAEFDLILFWLASRRGLLRSKVESDGLLLPSSTGGGPVLSVDDKIQILLMERLRMNAEVKDQWQDALAVMSLGENIPLSLSELHALADDILNLAGDKSVDASWYSKRMAVAAVYAASDFVMTRDTSAGLRDTEEFVARRWADARAVGNKLTGVRECLGFMGSTAVGLGRSWGLKI
ncbi:uncharacterized protein BP01DRAFT_355216 [Aspergillus saccharolyticus JOP 1030-1]|uniref:Ubiquinone biosynthesis protein n=1 Tax=Aspergillus saccharolyticus JOP 1030-1 TaxID=1450539 RepID=A0A318ZKA5_9EURO|nr:ubiquinone biosynthesis protein COQ9 [Aspergillus saccharolyticus JOP 1030-1]PYH46814.1 ubiquinone biosynthesis protein COQ9 [Aspergillus saccharolyticus JOP 1030-1]